MITVKIHSHWCFVPTAPRLLAVRLIPYSQQEIVAYSSTGKFAQEKRPTINDVLNFLTDMGYPYYPSLELFC